MTATLPAGRTSGAPAHRAPPAPRRGALGAARRHGLNTPASLRALLAGLILLILAWGAFGGFVATLHSSAAHSLVAVDEPLSLDARQMYQAIADADATITAAYLASSQPPLVTLQRYQNDIATAATDLSRLRSGNGSQATGTALAALSGGLPVYTGDVAEAQAEYAMQFPLTGGSFLQVASEEAHLTLLPAANTVFTQENAALSAASSDASDWITLVAALLLAVITGFVLYRAQRWLSRRTNRTFSIGLSLASVLLIISVAWLAAGFLTARSDLGRGFGSGSDPAENLALASIGVQQIRGDAVLNVISRSGNASFADDFAKTSKMVGPGSGTWLGAAAAAQQPGGQGAALVAQAEQEATDWYAANSQVYTLGKAAKYAAERTSVIATGSGGAATGYDALEARIGAAINTDQSVFQAAASAGDAALSPLAGVVIAGSLLMALCCAWGISRRLAEYR
jgi:hypothetical protein